MTVPKPVPAPGTLSRKRRVLVYVLVALGTLMLAISAFAVWTRAYVLDTDVWTATSSELIENEEIRAALSIYITDQVFSDEQVQATLTEQFPAALRPLAGPLTAAAAEAAQDVTYRLLSTQAVQNLFVAASRAAHSEFVDVIQNGSSATVVLNLGDIVTRVGERLGLPPNLTARLATAAGQITILESERLGTVRKAANALDILSFWLLIAVVAVWALAVYLARGQRRKTLLVTTGCLIGVGLLVLLGRRLVGNLVVEQVVADPTYRPAASAVWAIASDVLQNAAIASIFFGAIALAGLLLLGGGRRATSARRWLAPFMRDNPAVVWGLWALVVLLVLLFGPSSATRGLVTIVIIVVLAALGLWALRREILREFPDATRPAGDGPSALARARASVSDRLGGSGGPPETPGPPDQPS